MSHGLTVGMGVGGDPAHSSTQAQSSKEAMPLGHSDRQEEGVTDNKKIAQAVLSATWKLSNRSLIRMEGKSCQGHSQSINRTL